MGTLSNIQIQPMDVYIGTDQPLIQTISCVADVSSSLNSHYFVLFGADGSKHLFYMNVGSAGVDPAISGFTSHAVAFAANASASTVATAVQGVIDGLAAFIATVSGSVITVTNAANGYAPAGYDAQASASKTGFAFQMTQVGDAFENVGYLEGDIAVSGLSRSPVDILSHQKGKTVLGQILTGSGNPEMEFNLQEVTITNYRKLLRYSSGELYPIAASATSGLGGGSMGLFGSPVTTKVVLHPVQLGTADKTKDYCFWKCTLDLDKVSFSGDKILVLPVKVKAFEDTSKMSQVDVWMYGDWSQSFVNT